MKKLIFLFLIALSFSCFRRWETVQLPDGRQLRFDHCSKYPTGNDEIMILDIWHGEKPENVCSEHYRRWEIQ